MSIPDLERRLRRLTWADPPEGFGERTLALAATMRGLRRRLRQSLLAAAAAAGLAIGVGIWSSTEEPIALPAIAAPMSTPGSTDPIEQILDERARLAAAIRASEMDVTNALKDGLRLQATP